MDPLNFLAAVLPSSGVYCVAELSSPKKEHVFVDRIDEICPVADRLCDAGLDAYFALASFKEKGERKAGNAQALRSLFVDIDIGKAGAYTSRQEAAEAFDDFIQKTGLAQFGQPWIVSSGGGLHVYWGFDKELSVEEWKPIAEGFKKLARKEGLKIDFSVTADVARVLRVPNTLNFKTDRPRRVRLLVEGVVFSPESLKAHILGLLNEQSEPELALPGKRPTLPASTSSLKLFENTQTVFKTILDKSLAGHGCNQLKYYVENAQQDGMEPLWRGMLSLSQKCSDADEFNKYLTELHPYDEDRMNLKLREIKGPYPCTKFDSENPGVCNSCPHKNKITNPLALGRQVATTIEPKEIEVVPASKPVVQPAKVMRPTPPRGFSYGDKGGIFREKKDTDADGKEFTAQVMILPYDLFVLDILNIEGEHQVHMLAMRPEGMTPVVIPQRAVVSKDDTVKNLASQNIVASYGAGNDKYLFDYVRGCVEEASVSKSAVRVPPSYGWQDDQSFVVAEKIFTPGIPPRDLPMPNLANLNRNTQSVGTLDNWRRAINVLIHRQMYDILSLMSISFASPLMGFTGKSFRGMTFHVGSTDSGTGKTLALAMAASVWGDPTKYRVSKGTSHVAMLQRFGMLKSLPLICDEITDKNRKDFEWFPAFLFDVSEGIGKDRMEAGANKERLNQTEWNSMALLSSNTHVLDFLTGARKHSSEGEIRRVLEYTPPEKIVWGSGEYELIELIDSNFAVAGPQWAQWLVDNRETAVNLTRKVYVDIKQEFSFADDERFWRAGCAAIVAACTLVGSKHAKIIDIPLTGVKKFLLGLVNHARKEIKHSYRTAEDILNSYTREYYGKFVVVRSLEGALSTTLGENREIDESITRSEVMGRVERYMTPGMIDYYIEEQLLKTYCASMSFGYADFKKQMEKIYEVQYSKKDLLSKTKGPQMRVNVIKIRRREESAKDSVSVE